MVLMKFRNILTKALLAGTLAISQNLFFMSDQHQVKAQASSRPYVMLVNGYNDCCIWDTKNRGVDMEIVRKELERQGAEVRLFPWDNFNEGKGEISSTSNDAQFLAGAANYINNRLDPNRPLILIGHSYGGDSLLSLAPRINRRIQFLGVIDPTAAGGFREPITRRSIPKNVDFFFNRWQRNGLNSISSMRSNNIVPFDSRLVTGNIILCGSPTKCDQEEQSIARNKDGSPQTELCGWEEVTCPGYSLLPPSRGRKQKRLAHNPMPSDEYLQTQMANQIRNALTAFARTQVFRSLPETQISACEKLFSAGSSLVSPHTDQEGRTWNGEIIINSTLNGRFSDGLNSDNITINLDPNNRDSFFFTRSGGGQTWQGKCTQSSASGIWSNNFNNGRGTFIITPK
jgi:hypothetical protein